MERRASGVLLHPSSLPGPFGIGDIGPTAVAFLDWMGAAGQSVWQTLPLGPVGLGDSPYSGASAFAGNPLLISPEWLNEEGLLPPEALDDLPGREATVDFQAVRRWKSTLLRRSREHFQRRAIVDLRRELENFRESPLPAEWLDDWALYAALKGHQDGRQWTEWPPEIRLREPGALREAHQQLADEIELATYVQFLFHRQWRRLRREAAERGVRIFGDLPIYVAADSADVWVNRELFKLDDSGAPLVVAGVPPDYFSATGQRWGNPIYRWDRMEEDGFAWWIARLRANLELVDLLRIDHFRGFAGYWEVPADCPTAVEGRWQPGPGSRFFHAARSALGDLPLVAEDLGVITPDVTELRQSFGLPGMKVLQFGFAGTDSSHLPHHATPDTVLYTGTHDNDTAVGWYAGAGPQERRRAADYLGDSGQEIHWQLIRAAATSVADLVVTPLQDVLGLGGEARMNTPGVEDGNWRWRCGADDLAAAPAARLRRFAEITGRLSA